MRFSGFKESIFGLFKKKKPPVAQFAPPVAKFAPDQAAPSPDLAPEEDPIYFDFEFDDAGTNSQGHPTITMYRGLAGNYIPPGPKADQYMRDWETKLKQMFGGDQREEIKYLKRIGKLAIVSGLQRRNSPQAATTSIQQAIEYAIKEAKKLNGTPYVVKIKVPEHEASRSMIKGGGQTGFDVYEFSAEDFAFYYEQDGETMNLQAAQAELAKVERIYSRQAAYYRDVIAKQKRRQQNQQGASSPPQNYLMPGSFPHPHRGV